MSLGVVIAYNMVWLLGLVGFFYLWRSWRRRTSASPSEHRTAERLLELRTWLDQGAITNAEYDALRTRAVDHTERDR
jgi:hypothetical protein